MVISVGVGWCHMVRQHRHFALLPIATNCGLPLQAWVRQKKLCIVVAF